MALILNHGKNDQLLVVNYTSDLLEFFIPVCEKFFSPFVVKTGTWLKKRKSIQGTLGGVGWEGKV